MPTLIGRAAKCVSVLCCQVIYEYRSFYTHESHSFHCRQKCSREKTAREVKYHERNICTKKPSSILSTIFSSAIAQSFRYINRIETAAETQQYVFSLLLSFHSQTLTPSLQSQLVIELISLSNFRGFITE